MIAWRSRQRQEADYAARRQPRAAGRRRLCRQRDIYGRSPMPPEARPELGASRPEILLYGDDTQHARPARPFPALASSAGHDVSLDSRARRFKYRYRRYRDARCCHLPDCCRRARIADFMMITGRALELSGIAGCAAGRSRYLPVLGARLLLMPLSSSMRDAPRLPAPADGLKRTAMRF